MINIGADSARPVWLRSVMAREGDDVVTRCCVVTEGQFFPIEIRVSVPELIAQARALGLSTGGDSVGSFGSFLKRAVKKVTHNKIVEAVGKVVGKTVKSPVFQVASSIVAPGVAPGLLLGAHNASTFTGGKGIFTGPVKAIVDTTSQAALATVLPGVGPKALAAAQKLGSALRGGKSPLSVLPAIGAGALDFVSPQAAAALGLGLKTVSTAQAAGNIAAAARLVQREVSLGKTAARALAQQTTPNPAAARRLVQRAVTLQTHLGQAGPQLARRVVASTKVKNAIATIARKAKAGSADAQLAARVLASSHQALDAVAKAKALATGGVPGLLVTSTGRIIAAPKGRFVQRSTTATHPDVLYRGAQTPTLKGQFTAVSGTRAGVGASEAWGGEMDPGNDIEGPRAPATLPGDQVLLDDYSQVGARFGEPNARYSARVDRRALGVGQNIQFGVWVDGRVQKRTGIIEAVGPEGLRVRSKRGHHHPETVFTIDPEQVRAVRIDGGSGVGAWTP